MRFIIKRRNDTLEGAVSYLGGEYSISSNLQKFTDYWLLVNYVQLGFSLNTLAAGEAFGYFAKASWKKSPIVLPPYSTGDLLLAEPAKSGVYRLTKVDDWPAYHNPETDIVCLGDWQVMSGDATVEFTKSIWATISRQGELKALWFHIDKYVD
jgi:hypothetical protein